LVARARARYHSSVVTRKYPLDPLKRVRAEAVDQRARSLSQAIGEVEKARAEKERREHAKRELERSLSEVADAERERLEKGELSVADLARGAAFGIAGEMRRAAHERAAEQARAEHAKAVTSAEDKRKVLASARADAEVVEKHHKRWQSARNAEAIAKDEESAEEAHLGARAHRSKERGGR
jgi:hypothetical protein